MSNRLLEVKNLKTSFFTQAGEFRALRGVSFDLEKGETLGVVGESGSGKSVLAMSIMKVLQHSGKIIDGDILFENENLINKSERDMRKVRGNEISMIFQDPMSSLNPVYTIGNQIIEILLEHQDITKKQARQKSIKLLERVGIASPEQRIDHYPHELSGGMRQRVMIAMAMSCEPKLLIADEPTTSLDMTIQAQILELMKNLRDESNTSIIMITHDLGIIAEFCSKVIVMYGGLIMEEGSVNQIFYSPRHPYTMGLLKSIPKLHNDNRKFLFSIEGTPADSSNPPSGCPFHTRCEFAMKICGVEKPDYYSIEVGHRSMCWRLHEEAPLHEKFSKSLLGV